MTEAPTAINLISRYFTGRDGLLGGGNAYIRAARFESIPTFCANLEGIETELPNCSLSDCINNVRACAWMEITEEQALSMIDRDEPKTESEGGSW